MSLSDSKRYRQSLLEGLTDDGLEELTLRLVKPDYPDAFRIRGNDGGIDVFSDHGSPPKRAWQAKNYKSVPWSACRDSLEAAMEGVKPPHYTFVFPFPLTKNQLEFWRDDFYPEQIEKYPDLTLDYMDDLAEQLEACPDLVDLLSDGAFGEYFRATFKQTADSGVSPIARASELISDPSELAKKAVEIGKGDPHFSYGYSAREASGTDQEIAEQGVRFTMNHAIDELPNFAVTLRDGDGVTELTAKARDDAVVKGAEPRFEASEDGERARALARASLSKGEPIEFDEDAVAVKPGAVPDKFREKLSDDGLLRQGRIRLGLSEPVELQVSLTVDCEEKRISIPLYRIPGETDTHVGWGGSFYGALITLDFEPQNSKNDQDVLMNLGLGLGVDGMPAGEALNGLGFVQAFDRADRIHLACPELLPADGLEAPIAAGTRTNPEVSEKAAALAGAMALLEQRDGQPRLMPRGITEADFYASQMVLKLLPNGRIEMEAKEEFHLPLPPEKESITDLDELLDLELEIPPIAGQATGVKVRRQLLDIAPVEIIEVGDGRRHVRFRPAAGTGRALIDLVEDGSELDVPD